MDRKRSSQNITKTALKPYTRLKRKYHSVQVQTFLIMVTTENVESYANKKFDHTGFTLKVVERGIDNYYGVRTQELSYTKSGHVAYQIFTDFSRTTVLDTLRTLGNTPSPVIHRLIRIGLSARQIGQIRRWHISDWRVLPVKIHFSK